MNKIYIRKSMQALGMRNWMVLELFFSLFWVLRPALFISLSQTANSCHV